MNRERAKVAVPERVFDFGKVIRGAIVSHAFTVRNGGATTLVITSVSMTAPLSALELPKQIPPGAEERIPIVLDTAQVRGLFEGRVFVFLASSPEPEVLEFEGQVIETIEVSPRPAFFLGARRGEARQASLEIINHEPEALTIAAVEHATERFTTKLETLEAGRRYRLTMTINPDGPGGRHRDLIRLRTSSRNHPALAIWGNTDLRERVYAFPDVADFGALAVSEIRANPNSLRPLTQVIIVRQTGGTEFAIRASSDLPFLSVKTERTPEQDAYQVRLGLIAREMNPGAIRGKVSIQTNDTEFPLIVVPVSGYVLDR